MSASKDGPNVPDGRTDPLSHKLLHITPSILALTLCAGRLLLIVKEYSVNVFIGDQWFYNEPTLFNPQSAWTIFRWQSGPWRQGLGGLLSAAIGSVSHWNSREESFVAAGLIILGCVLALYLSVRVKKQVSAWDCLVPLLALTPVQYQTVVGVTHYSHGPLPLLLVIAFCLAWTVRRPGLKYGLGITIAFFCTYTGLGLFIGLLCPIVIALECWTRRTSADRSEQRLGITAFIVSILSLMSFFVGFKFSDGVCPANAFTDPASGLAVHYPNPLHYFLFLAFMFGNFVGLKATIALVPSILGGSAVLLFVLGGFLFGITRENLPTVPLVLIAYSLLFALATAHGRMCLGLGAALGSRYMIYLIPSFIGIYLLAVTDASGTARATLLIGLAGVVLTSSFIVHRSDRDEMAEYRRQKTEWKQCYLAQHDLLDCNARTGATIYTYPNNIQEKIDILERRRLNFYYDQNR